MTECAEAPFMAPRISSNVNGSPERPQGSENHVDVIGHDDDGVNSCSCCVVVQAMRQHCIARVGLQFPPAISYKGDEMWPSFFLYVRQIAAINVFPSRHFSDARTRTAALGCADACSVTPFH